MEEAGVNGARTHGDAFFDGAESLQSNGRRMISARQLTMLCAVSLISPATQMLPAWAAGANQSGWLILLPVLPVNLILVWMLGHIYKRRPDVSLTGLYLEVLGGVLGRCVLFAAGVLAPLVLAVFSIRVFGSRFASTIFPYSPDSVFIWPLMAFTFVVTRRGLSRTARLGGVFFWGSLVMLVLLFLGALGSIRADNLLPVSPRDYGNLAVSSLSGLSLFGVFAMGGLLTQHVRDRTVLGRETGRAMVLMTVLLTFILVICVGVLGSGLTGLMSFPVFSAVKALRVPGALERVDAFIITLWMLSDIAITILCFMTATNVLGRIFGCRRYSRLSAPLHFLVFALTGLVSDNLFSVLNVMRFAVEPFCYLTIILSAVLTFAVGKARRRI